MSNAALRIVIREVIRRNSVQDGIIYVQAREAFLTSTVVDLLPVVTTDGEPVRNGQPGTLSGKLREYYLARAASAI
jgi:hypothetical protein